MKCPICKRQYERTDPGANTMGCGVECVLKARKKHRMAYHKHRAEILARRNKLRAEGHDKKTKEYWREYRKKNPELLRRIKRRYKAKVKKQKGES